MKRKPVKPLSKDLENQIKDAVSPAKRNVGAYESNYVKSSSSTLENKTENQVLNDQILKLNIVIAQRDREIEILDDKIKSQISELRKTETTIAQLREALALKDGELEVAKEQMGILELDCEKQKKDRETLSAENKYLVAANSTYQTENINLIDNISAIKQKWYYRWFS